MPKKLNIINKADNVLIVPRTKATEKLSIPLRKVGRQLVGECVMTAAKFHKFSTYL